MYVLGFNHKTAPISIRERFFLNSTQQDLLLSELKSHAQILEAFILSTCNRLEIYFHVLDGVNDCDFIYRILSRVKRIPVLTAQDRTYFYLLKNEQMVEHLFRVASGLDSLVLGEKQILGQVKTSAERAREMGILNKHFNILTNLAIRAGKKAQTETDISRGGSSISWAAIQLAEQILHDLTGKSLLIIGAGKMGQLAMEQIAKRNLANIYLMNRTVANADSLVNQFGGLSRSFSDIKETLADVDLCICSAGAPHYIIEKPTMERVMRSRSNRPLLMLDISMPRNIDPAIKDIEHVELFAIDDLKQTVEDNMLLRQQAVQDVEVIVRAKTADFWRKIDQAEKYNQVYYSAAPN